MLLVSEYEKTLSQRMYCISPFFKIKKHKTDSFLLIWYLICSEVQVAVNIFYLFIFFNQIIAEKLHTLELVIKVEFLKDTFLFFGKLVLTLQWEIYNLLE